MVIVIAGRGINSAHVPSAHSTSKPGMSKTLRCTDSTVDKDPREARFGTETVQKMRYPRTTEKLNLGADLEHACVGSFVLSEHVVGYAEAK